MNSWSDRIATGLLYGAALWLHSFCFGGGPNTPEGMLIFHGSAGLFDLGLLVLSRRLLDGKLCVDMQYLCYLSIAVNFTGWILYMAYAPPYFYNSAQWVLSFIQWGRLFLVDGDNADSRGVPLVHRPAVGWPKLHFRKKNQP